MNRKSYLAKLQKTRTQVMRLIAKGVPQNEVAVLMGKHPSSICRMVKREKAK